MSMLNIVQWSGELDAMANSFAHVALRAAISEKPTVTELDMMENLAMRIGSLTTSIKAQLMELEK